VYYTIGEPSDDTMDEFERIVQLANVLPMASGRGGIGDDAALLDHGGAVTTDTMVEDVHFRLDWSDWTDVGYKLVASNISDLLAMGASAERCFLNLALSCDLKDDGFHDLLSGIREGMEEWAPTLLVSGGDTTSTGRAASVLTMTVVGRPFGRRYWFRDGAKDKDAIWLDGQVGLAAAGVALLSEAGPHQTFSHAEQRFLDAHRRPKPPDWLSLGAPIEHEPNAAIDVSDGLVADLQHILNRSGLSGAKITTKLPGLDTLHTVFSEKEALEYCLSGGDDYCRIAVGSESPGEYWHRIGEVRSDLDGVFLEDGTTETRRWDGKTGFRHFSD
jgi:thiamine-monophosphate kinase